MNGHFRRLAALVALLLAILCCARAEETSVVPGTSVVPETNVVPGTNVLSGEGFASGQEAEILELSTVPIGEGEPGGAADATEAETLVEPVEPPPGEVEADFGFEAAEAVTGEAALEVETLPVEADRTETEDTPEPPEPSQEPDATPTLEPTPTPEPTATPAPIDENARQALFSSIGKKGNARRIPVLAYHRIVSDEEKGRAVLLGDRFSISLSRFTEQMAWLHEQQYIAITCDELYRWHKGNLRLPKKSVLITFDDGYAKTVEYALKVFQTYGLRGTFFVVGEASWFSDGSEYVTRERIRQLRSNCPWIDFQSHTWGIHRHMPDALSYEDVFLDAAQQRRMYGFDYLAYPFGRCTRRMIRAYREDGVRMAFLFGRKRNGYATRRQNPYKIKRIEVTADMSMRRFRRWCRREMK